ncbi:MAG: asparagine synthase-related protein [Planctomycetota bacterium]|jgi:asparagine synthetase B (glutamine-hydrolysing)
MFLLAITNDRIEDKFQSYPVHQVMVGLRKGTVVTDNFLSRIISKPDGFSIIESPPGLEPDGDGIILSLVDYNQNEGVINVSAATTSGRPIFYHFNSKGDFFCSTNISLLREANVPIEENPQVLPEFLIYSFVTPPQTLYKNIMKLSNGGRLSVEAADGECRVRNIERFDPPAIDYEKFGTVSACAENTLGCLDDFIQALNPCKDRISVLLSGGLDSSILCRMCQQNHSVNTSYSTGYPFEAAEQNREKKYATSAAAAFGTNHNYYETTTREFLHGFLESIAVAEVPVKHFSAVMLYLLFKNALPEKEDVVVIGHGADNLFGLPSHTLIFDSQKAVYELLSRYPVRKAIELLSRMTGRGRRFARRLGNIADCLKRKAFPTDAPENVLWSYGACGSEDWVCNYFNVTMKDIIEGRYECIKPYENRSFYEMISVLAFSGESSEVESIWTKLAESQRKIACYPYNSPEILKNAYSIPWEIKLRRPKNVLRNVARKLEIPEFIITRGKLGFGIQTQDWAKTGGIFDPLIPLVPTDFDMKQIRNLQSGDPRKAMTFWNILNYFIWKRLCINGESLTGLKDELEENILEQKRILS